MIPTEVFDAFAQGDYIPLMAQAAMENALSPRLLDRWPFTGVVAVPGIEVSARAKPFANGRPLVLQAMDLGSSPLRAA
jgi:hypothetical protein